MKQSFSSQYVVITVFSYFGPFLFRYRLVPVHSQLLVMNAKINLKLLQALLLTAKVKNVGEAIVPCFPEISIRVSANNSFTYLVYLFWLVPKSDGMKNMVIVLSIVESNQIVLKQFLNITRLRIDESHNRMLRPIDFPVYHVNVREYLNIKEGNSPLVFFSRGFSNFRYIGTMPLHLRYQVRTKSLSIVAAHSETIYGLPHLANVIALTTLICLVQNILDEDACRSGMLAGFNCFFVFRIPGALHGFPDTVDQIPLEFHYRNINHVLLGLLLLFFLRQSGTDRGNWNIITKAKAPSNGSLAVVNLNLHIICIHAQEILKVSRISVIQMNASPAFTEFSIRGWPFTCCLKISFTILLAFVILQIKVNHEQPFRRQNIMQLFSVQISQMGIHFAPACRRFVSVIRIDILSNAVFENIIQQTCRTIHLKPT